MTNKHEITRADILSMEDYAALRKAKRAEMIELKRHRRMGVGPYATFYFENYDTMWHQVHEMLYTERGGEEQIADELAAYNPLIPNGRELVATLMFEIEDERRRRRILGQLGGVEDTVTLTLGEDVISARPERDVERSTAEGKTSSVHFLHFPFTPDQVRAFCDGSAKIVLGIHHPRYQHMAVMPDEVRQALAADFD